MVPSIYARLASVLMYGIAGVVGVAVVTASTGLSTSILGALAVACTMVVAREIRNDDILAWTMFVCVNALTVCVMALPAALRVPGLSSRPPWVPLSLTALAGLGLLLAVGRAASARRLGRVGG